MMFRRFLPVILTAICTILAAFFLTGCPISIPDPWPIDFDDLFSFNQTDTVDDVLLEVLGDPGSPYAVTYFRIDVTEVSLGMVLDDEQIPEDDYLYIRVDSVDPVTEGILGTGDPRAILVPAGPEKIVDIPGPAWPGGAEKVIAHKPQVGFDVDNNPGTGIIRGNEVTFDMSFVYGGTNSVYGSYLLPPSNQGNLSGELCVWCGSGHFYFVVRYDISGLKKYIGSGTSVTVNYYSSIVCVDSGGNELETDYYAYDETTSASWDVPW